eukprot:3042729-Pyramimonas_sp.AAC.1
MDQDSPSWIKMAPNMPQEAPRRPKTARDGRGASPRGRQEGLLAFLCSMAFRGLSPRQLSWASFLDGLVEILVCSIATVATHRT